MPPVDRALLMELFFGVLRRLRSLDFFIAEVRPQPLDVLTKNALRVGLYQIFHMRYAMGIHGYILMCVPPFRDCIFVTSEHVRRQHPPLL